MAQSAEHILGKDEVPSSNLGSSSKKIQPALVVGCIFFFGSVTPHSKWALCIAQIQFAYRHRRYLRLLANTCGSSSKKGLFSFCISSLFEFVQS